ncbi:transposase [Penicillium atrosanguineum]|uniref:Transposase n=1 Tax=Penicillium atrosanguineum TaxID=1132637 RepID=A0A9W9PWS3_9EURO|nr:transposase [Penicillium atrosanguineum]KAJ5315715.1 transposase [Penicillium atrosanguineum]
MPVSSKAPESRVIEACEAARADGIYIIKKIVNKCIQALEWNYKKLSKIQNLTSKQRWNLLRDANQSIANRKANEGIQDKKRLAKLHEKVYGKPPPKQPTRKNEASIEAVRAAGEAHELLTLIRIRCVD